MIGTTVSHYKILEEVDRSLVQPQRGLVPDGG
jgi:hypothetical protein